MARGVERRAARVTAPRWVPAALALRGLLVRLDDRLAQDEKIARALREGEANPEGHPDAPAGDADRRGEAAV